MTGMSVRVLTRFQMELPDRQGGSSVCIIFPLQDLFALTIFSMTVFISDRGVTHATGALTSVIFYFICNVNSNKIHDHNIVKKDKVDGASLCLQYDPCKHVCARVHGD